MTQLVWYVGTFNARDMVMVVIRAELWKGGDPNNKVHLGTAYITNKGGSETVANYEVKLTKRNSETLIWKQGTVGGFPRKRLGVWDLLYRALKHIVGDRNG